MGIASCGSTTKRPNILLITMDYWRGIDLPMMGATYLKVPNIDRLCREGAVFTRHSCVSPICMPARATLVTGLYPHRHSLWDNAAIPVKKNNDPFLIASLQHSGYQTVGIGKMHFHPRGDDYNFDIRISLEGKDVKYRDDDYEAYLEKHQYSRADIRTFKSDWGLPPGQDIYDWPLADSLHADGFVGHAAINTVANDHLAKDRPWFLWVSFTGPHNPWNAPKKYVDLYEGIEVPMGDFVSGELQKKPIEYSRHRYGYGGDLFEVYDPLARDMQDSLRRALRVAHYGSLSFIDELIGRLFNVLNDKHALANTIIVLTSDHGSALFDNEMLHKGSPFPTQSLVQFIVWHPTSIKPGIRNGFSSHADFFATVVDWAAIHNPAATQGESLMPILTDAEAKIHQYAIIESALVTSIITDHWLAGYHHLSQEKELYNLQNDPMCHENIGAQTSSKIILDSLGEVISKWRHSQSSETSLSDDPVNWPLRMLGDTFEIHKYRDRYISEYHNLATLADERPGITGVQSTRDTK